VRYYRDKGVANGRPFIPEGRCRGGEEWGKRGRKRRNWGRGVAGIEGVAGVEGRSGGETVLCQLYN